MGRTVIIAEAGVNHNGSIELARKLVEMAAKAGADYVKFRCVTGSFIDGISAEEYGRVC